MDFCARVQEDIPPRLCHHGLNSRKEMPPRLSGQRIVSYGHWGSWQRCSMFLREQSKIPVASLTGVHSKWISRRSKLFNKKMITMLVLLTVLVAGSANAGDYEVYGKLHLSMDMLNDSDASEVTLNSNTSYFGIKGTRELNENFTFIWQFENSLNLTEMDNQANFSVDEGSGEEDFTLDPGHATKSTLASRNTFLGLKGTWGKALFGIYESLFWTLGHEMTFFVDDIGDHRTTTMGWDQRYQQIAMYTTPDFNGFGASLAYQFYQDSKLDIAYDPDDSTLRDNYEGKNTMSGSAMYKTDAIMVGAAYEYRSKGCSGMGGGTEYMDGENGIRLAGKYTMEKFAVSAMFQNLSNVNQSWNGDTLESGGSATTMGMEAKYQFNPKFAFKGSFYMANPDGDQEDDTTTTDIDESANTYNLLALGIDHTFAKDLVFYMQYAMVMNDDYQEMGLGGNWRGSTVDASAVGESPIGFSVGMWKKF